MISLRQCSTCDHFVPGSDDFLPNSRTFTGRCGHPLRQLPCEPQPWTRERELPCRLEWDSDLWEPRRRDDDHLVDLRMLDPRRPGPGPNGPTRNFLQRLLILPDLPLIPDLHEVWVGEEIGPLVAEEEWTVDAARYLHADFAAWPWKVDRIRLFRRRGD